MMMKDTYRTKGLRRQMVERLLAQGIGHEPALRAMAKVPRHFFIDSAFLEHAYQDKPFAIGEGQTISQPYTVAMQTALLDPQPNDKVLEIGTGSGYQSSVLLELGVRLFTLEYKSALHDKAAFLLRRMGYRQAVCRCGDGSMGWAAHAPYQGILVTAGAPTVPEALKEQLAVGGRLVIPVGCGQTQQMLRITKLPDGGWQEEQFGEYSFVPLLGKEGWAI
jgi:protein-L-isoaspartate(D-aspartate) O-methyltransferase